MPAVIKWCEELQEIAVASSSVLKLSYDEAHLLATLRLPPAQADARQFAPVANNALEAAADELAQRYNCQSRLLADGTLVMAFEAWGPAAACAPNLGRFIPLLSDASLAARSADSCVFAQRSSQVAATSSEFSAGGGLGRGDHRLLGRPPSRRTSPQWTEAIPRAPNPV